MDIGFAISILTQQLENSKPSHFLMAKRVLKYLIGIKNFGLILGGEAIPSLLLFSDANFANNQTDRKSIGDMLHFREDKKGFVVAASSY